MAFEIINKPDDDQQAVEIAKDIINAATMMDIDLDVQGFVFSWAAGTRVVIERDNDGNITSFGLLASGPRWTHNDITAHVLRMAGNTDALIEFFKVMCNAIGAKSLFYQEEVPLEETSAYNRYIVREIKV